MTTTPAPSLEDLPPLKGTILVLHPINEQYNGKLVEFLKKDPKDSDKIFVGLLNDDAATHDLHVKRAWCRRPDIQPRKLRMLLNSLSAELLEDMYNTGRFTDFTKEKIMGFLKRDPCCVIAHDALGFGTLLGDRTFREALQAGSFDYASNGVTRAAVKHYRRAVQSLYAYNDVLVKNLQYKRRMDAQIATYLSQVGHHKSSIRMNHRALESADASGDALACVVTQYWMARSLHIKADNATKPEESSVWLDGYVSASHHYLKAVEHYVVNFDKLDDAVGDGTDPTGIIEACLSALYTIYVCLVRKKLEIGFDGVFSRQLVQNFVKIVEGVLKVCSDAAGVVHLLDGSEKYLTLACWTKEAEIGRAMLAMHEEYETKLRVLEDKYDAIVRERRSIRSHRLA